MYSASLCCKSINLSSVLSQRHAYVQAPIRSAYWNKLKRRVSVLQLPGVQGLPGPSVYGGGFAPTVDSVAQAAAEGQWKTYACSARQMVASCNDGSWPSSCSAASCKPS